MQFELARVLGLRGLTIGDGRCVWATTIEDVHRNPYGIAHGGVLFTLVDYAMGGALTSVLEGGQRCTTLEIKINYVAPATEGEIRAEAWVVSKGARIAVMEAKVTAGETLLAVATGTFYIQAAPVY
jgi:acyl-CoA thioesterase